MADKQKVLMYFSYIGTGYCGSQYQICRATGTVYPTIQNSIEQGLKKLFRLQDERPIIIRLCSRTDAGVHALKAALTVDLPKFRGKFLSPDVVKNGLNKYFGNSCSIRISDVINVPDSFNFRETCLSKTYVYRLGVLRHLQENQLKKQYYTPVSELNRTFFFFPKAFDVEKVEEAMRLFVGEKDFVAVGRKSKQNPRPTVCNILSFTIENVQPLMPLECGTESFVYYHLTCKGTRFLFHMVRAMVGAVLSVGKGVTTLDEIRKLFEKPEPPWLSKMAVVPAYGLYLADTNLDLQKLIMKEKENCEADNSVLKNSEMSSAEAA